MSAPCIVAVFGPSAERLAHYLASDGDIVVPSRSISPPVYMRFEPLCRTFAWATEEKGVIPWRNKAIATIRAGDDRAVVMRGTFNGHRQGDRFSWGHGA